MKHLAYALMGFGLISLVGSLIFFLIGGLIMFADNMGSGTVTAAILIAICYFAGREVLG